MIWDEDAPEAARWRCPHCAKDISERHKPAMVADGRWRALRPEVQGHAGFRLSALFSLHANAAWGKLATEFLAAKDDPTTLQTFVNTILGQGWRAEGNELDETDMQARAKPFGLDQVPAEVLALTLGCDVQHDRLELTYIGWTETGCMLVLGRVGHNGFLLACSAARRAIIRAKTPWSLERFQRLQSVLCGR